MEKSEENDDEASSTSSHQNTMWKQFQARAKPILSPKLSARNPDEKKEKGSLWMFRKKKKHPVLDRVISSSQPDLFSEPVGLDMQESPLCGKVDPSTSHSSRQASEETMQPDTQRVVVGSGITKPTLVQLVQSHHKSSSLGSSCLERLVADPSASGSDSDVGEKEAQLDKDDLQVMGATGASGVNSDRALPSSEMYQLDIVLKRGHNLAIRDRGGTSDPYVKFKLCGKEVFRSKTIHKNLNPVWDEGTKLLVDSLQEPLYVKVFDYDFGLQDDFMGSAYLYLESLEQQRAIPVTLTLQDPHYPDVDLGTLELTVTLRPKDGSIEEPHRDATTMLLKRTWRRSSKQSVRLAELHRKHQLWRGIVSISLIEGRDLCPMDPNGLSDPYAKFRLGNQKYRSKTMPKTLCPQWREQFDLHLYEETGGVLEIAVWDKDTGRRDDFIGRCTLDLSTLAKEHTHRLELALEESRGSVVLLVTLTASSHVSIADLSLTPLDDPIERREIIGRYGMFRPLSNLKDVGIVQVKVMRAEGLMAADVTGKSDPFCVLELNNDRLQTHTIYKNLNPEWNKVFTFNVKDIHSVLEVTVFDEDRDRSADFLGKVAIPLLHIQNGEQKGYVLKNKEMTGPTKGLIYLESDVIYSTVKAGLRTIVPPEQKYIEEEPKVSKHLLQQNFNRVKRCIMFVINIGTFINSCFEWESPQRSISAFLFFVVVVWNFELYMVPGALLLLLTWNYFITAGRESGDTVGEATFEWEEEEEEKDDKDSERKGFMDKLYALQDVCVSVQSALDDVASYGERIKNTFNWTVPFLSWLAISVLCVATVLLYLIPLRYLVLAWGVNKFTKKLRNPYLIENNEVLDFLSRVPSDVQMMQYRELKFDPGQSPSKRKKTNLG
ncbi:multiple C2 and transmembrane domain-containing protein 1 isoform X2 [Salmo salar]|uniref:Multiple C2 and transmembrane domain-containing protein 1 isoform X2 n=1 Tax=Salmo salar TaxID=8030 RepID=A0A1S3KYP8_SALSA|nr:multiple C2 and transmembrane domain-containing protein 1-like isoform X2 [Salmo salar]|eukprot:XP_013983783.1 PREDICTED: multiple C2 and transmembrane domain-containing protein 1-like isoform X2 [Salmo salar]